MQTAHQSKDKFFINDNGHLNLRSQQYATLNQQITQIQFNKQTQELPGPGAYNTCTESFPRMKKSSSP